MHPSHRKTGEISKLNKKQTKTGNEELPHRGNTCESSPETFAKLTFLQFYGRRKERCRREKLFIEVNFLKKSNKNQFLHTIITT